MISTRTAWSKNIICSIFITITYRKKAIRILTASTNHLVKINLMNPKTLKLFVLPVMEQKFFVFGLLKTLVTMK